MTAERSTNVPGEESVQTCACFLKWMWQVVLLIWMRPQDISRHERRIETARPRCGTFSITWLYQRECSLPLLRKWRRPSIFFCGNLLLHVKYSICPEQMLVTETTTLMHWVATSARKFTHKEQRKMTLLQFTGRSRVWHSFFVRRFRSCIICNQQYKRSSKTKSFQRPRHGFNKQTDVWSWSEKGESAEWFLNSEHSVQTLLTWSLVSQEKKHPNQNYTHHITETTWYHSISQFCCPVMKKFLPSAAQSCIIHKVTIFKASTAMFLVSADPRWFVETKLLKLQLKWSSIFSWQDPPQQCTEWPASAINQMMILFHVWMKRKWQDVLFFIDLNLFTVLSNMRLTRRCW